MRTARRSRRLDWLAWLAISSGLCGCSPSPQTEEPLRIGVITSENQIDTEHRHEPLVGYLGRVLNRPVELREASDYAAVVESLRSGRMDLAFFGPASYARAWMVTGGEVLPLVSPTDEGVWGYHSAVVVRADSPYQSLDDLAGKSFAFVDPNSTSGYQALHFYLTKQGYPPETFFGNTGFAGSHDNGVLAVLNGAYDAAGTWWENDEYSSFKRMEIKGMIDAADLRVIWKSPVLPDRPWTVRSDMPEELRARISRALIDLPEADPPAFRQLTDGKWIGFREVSHTDYADVVEMLRHNQETRRLTP